jgi:chromosome segregation ATPase
MDEPSGEMLADRRVRAAEIAVRREREQRREAEALVADLTTRIELLGQELAGAREEPDRLRAIAADHARRRRAAEQREHAERAARIELETARDRLAAKLEGAERAAALGELRAELEELQDAVEREGAARAWAEARAGELERQLHQHAARSVRVYEAFTELRGLLDGVRADPVVGAVEAARLDAARTRLRQMIPPRETPQQAGETVAGPASDPRGVRFGAYAR